MPQMVTTPTQQGATVTAFIAQVALGDLPFGTLEYNSIFAAGLALLVLTLHVQLRRVLAATPLPGGLLMTAIDVATRARHHGASARPWRCAGSRTRSFIVWGIVATMIGLGTLVTLVGELMHDGGHPPDARRSS